MEHEHEYRKLNFEEAWSILQEEAISKVIDNLETEEGLSPNLFTGEQYIRFYTIVYTICTNESRTYEDAQSLYDNYRRTIEEYTLSKILPSLQGKTNEVLLQELVKQWNNHRRLTSWLSNFFNYLQRYFIPRRELRPLKGTSYSVFYELVYGEISDQILSVVLSLIRKEREGMAIDKTLVKNVLNIYIEMGEGSTKYYEKDFEGPMLDDTYAFYSSKAKDWIPVLSQEDYMDKFDDCLDQEEERITAYLSNISHKDKLLDIVRKELDVDERNRQRGELDFFDSVFAPEGNEY